MTPNYHIPVWDTITTSWNKVYGTKKSVWAAIGIILIIGIAFGAIEGSLKYLALPLAASIVYSISQFIMSLLNFGLIFIGIKRAMNQPVNFRQVYYAFDWKIIWNVILLHILYFLIILPIALLFMGSMMLSHIAMPLGIALGIATFILAIYVGTRILLAIGFLLEQRMNAWHALKRSYYVTQSNVLRIIAIVLLQSIIVIISAIPLGIGLIWTVPFSLINYGLIYQRLQNNA